MISLGEAVVSINGDLTGLDKALSTAKGRITGAVQGMTQAGKALTMGVTLPLVGVGVAAAKVGMDYQSSMNMLQAVTGASAEEMALMGNQAKLLGADMELPATSAGNAALAMTELGKAGLSVNDVLGASKGVLQLAAAGALSEAQAAEIAANALNMFNLEGTDATRVADLLAAAANRSSAEVKDVADSMAMAGSVFAAAGIPIEDLTTAIGLMANEGIKGSDAGTSLKTMLLSLEAPTSKAAALMAEMGINIYDANGAMLPFDQIIGQFSGTMGALTQQQRDEALATIFGTDAVRAANIVMLGGVDAFNEMKDAVTEEGAAKDLSAARTKGMAGAIDGLKSQLETFLLTIFDSIGGLEGFIRTIAAGVGALTAFAEQHPGLVKIVLIIGAIVAAIGPLLLIAGQMIAMFSTLTTIVAAAGAVMPVVGAAIAAIATPIGVVILVIAALAAAWKLNLFGIQDITKNVFGAIKEFIEDLAAAFREGGIPGALKFLRDKFDEALEAVKSKVKEWVQVGKDIVDGLIRGITSKLNEIKDAAVNLVTSAIDAAKAAAGISSPSKVFIVIGESTAEGLIVGMRNKIPGVAQASKDLAAATQAGFTLSSPTPAADADRPDQLLIDAALANRASMERLREEEKKRHEERIANILREHDLGKTSDEKFVDQVKKENARHQGQLAHIQEMESTSGVMFDSVYEWLEQQGDAIEDVSDTQTAAQELAMEQEEARHEAAMDNLDAEKDNWAEWKENQERDLRDLRQEEDDRHDAEIDKLDAKKRFSDGVYDSDKIKFREWNEDEDDLHKATMDDLDARERGVKSVYDAEIARIDDLEEAEKTRYRAIERAFEDEKILQAGAHQQRVNDFEAEKELLDDRHTAAELAFKQEQGIKEASHTNFLKWLEWESNRQEQIHEDNLNALEAEKQGYEDQIAALKQKEEVQNRLLDRAQIGAEIASGYDPSTWTAKIITLSDEYLATLVEAGVMTAQQAARSGTMAQGDLDMLLQVAEQKQKLASLDTADQVDALETASAAVDARIADENTRYETVLANLEAQKAAEATNYDAWKVNFDKRVGDEKTLYDQAIENISDRKTEENLAYQDWKIDFDARKLDEDRANEDTMLALQAEAALAKSIQDAALAAIEAESVAEDLRHEKRERQLRDNWERVQDTHDAWMQHLEDLEIAEDAAHDKRLRELRELADAIDDRYDREIDRIAELQAAEDRLHETQEGSIETMQPQEGGFYSRPAPGSTTGGTGGAGLGGAIEGKLNDARSTGEAWTGLLGKGIKEGIPDLTDALQKVRDLLPSSPAKTGPFESYPKTIYPGWEGMVSSSFLDRMRMGAGAFPGHYMSYEDYSQTQMESIASSAAVAAVNAMGPTRLELNVNGPISIRSEDDITKLAAQIESMLANRLAQRALGTT